MAERISKQEAARQFAAADKRIKGISSIAQSTIKRSKVLEVEKQYGTIKGNKQAVSSVDRALKSLTKSTQALALGVKLITVETARGVKNITQTGASVIGEYTKALGEDIHMKREGMMVALTAKITPFIGYAIAKLFETTVFKNMVEKMKAGLDRALRSVSSRFKKLASAGWEKSKEFWNSLRDRTSKKRGSINVQVKNAKKNSSGQAGTKKSLESQVPHMAKGGYVKKEGIAKVHAAEVVQPVGNVVEEIVNQVNKRVDAKEKKQKSFLSGTVFESSRGKKAKDFFGFEKVGSSIRNAFEIMTRSNLDLERQIMRRDKTEQRGLVKSFITAYAEEAKQEELPLMERQVQATIELKKTISGQNKVTQAAWNKMLYEHPVFHAIYASSKWAIKAMGMPVSFLFKKRGIYANRLSKRGTVFERLLDAMTNVYTGLMGKMDDVIGNTYVSAAATAKANNGKADGLTKAPKQGGYTIAGAAARLVGKGIGAAYKVGKWGLRKTAFKDMDQEKWDKFDKFDIKGAAKKWKKDAKDKLKKKASSPFEWAWDRLQYRSKEDQEIWKRDLQAKANLKKMEKSQRKSDWLKFKDQKEEENKKWKTKQRIRIRKEAIEKKRQEAIDKENEEDKKWTEASRGKRRSDTKVYTRDSSGKWKSGSQHTYDQMTDAAKKKKAEREEEKKYSWMKKIKYENKGDKDKTGQRTQFSIFKSIEKVNKKNLKQNTTQAKSTSKLTKFMTGWRRFLPFIKTAFASVVTVITSLSGMLFSGITALIGLLGGSWLFKKPLKALGATAGWVLKGVAKGGEVVVKAGLKTKVGQKIAASGAGVVAAKVLKDRAAKKLAAKTASDAALKAGAKTAAKTTAKIGTKLAIGAGTMIGLGFAANRLKKGQFIEAGLELLSTGIGVASTLSAAPTLGLGTVAGISGMVGIEAILYKRDKARNKKHKEHKNLDKSTVKKIQQIQKSFGSYLPIFAGFTGSATAMLSAAYLNKYSVNNPDTLVKAANQITGVSKKAWIAAGGDAVVYAGAQVISKGKNKIKEMWDKKKGMFASAASMAGDYYDKIKDSAIADEAESMYSKAKKYGKKALKSAAGIDFKEKAQDMYSGFKQKAMDATDKMPTLMSKLGDNIVSSFMKFGNFLSESIGDPKEHYINMKEKVFAGITKARDSLSSIYSKLHDLVLLAKMSIEMEVTKLKSSKAKENKKKRFGMFNFLSKDVGGDQLFPKLVSPSARISAGAGIGFKFNQDSKFAVGEGHKGETGVMGGSGMSFISPDKVREGLFGGLGIDSKKVASLSAGKDILKMQQGGMLQDSINGMKDTMQKTSQTNANMMNATIDKSVKVMSSNSNVSSGGGGGSSQPSRPRDPFINLILSGNIT